MRVGFRGSEAGEDNGADASGNGRKREGGSQQIQSRERANAPAGGTLRDGCRERAFVSRYVANEDGCALANVIKDWCQRRPAAEGGEQDPTKGESGKQYDARECDAKRAAMEDVSEGLADEHWLTRAQEQHVGATNWEGVEVGDEAKTEQNADGRAEAPAPGDFRQRKGRAAEHGAKAFRSGVPEGHCS